jgi:hypothetical protein
LIVPEQPRSHLRVLLFEVCEILVVDQSLRILERLFGLQSGLILPPVLSGVRRVDGGLIIRLADTVPRAIRNGRTLHVIQEILVLVGSAKPRWVHDCVPACTGSRSHRISVGVVLGVVRPKRVGTEILSPDRGRFGQRCNQAECGDYRAKPVPIGRAHFCSPASIIVTGRSRFH